MTDWKVKVITKSNQVKDVVVYDYTYPGDAIDAAIAQTNAKNYISVIPHYPVEDYSTYNSYNTNAHSSNSHDDSEVELTGTEGVLLLLSIFCFLISFNLGLFLFIGTFVLIIIRLIKEYFNS